MLATYLPAAMSNNRNQRYEINSITNNYSINIYDE